MKLKFITDPKTKSESVSLTLMMVSFIFAVVACALNLAGITNHTSVTMELFYSSSALYFGRKLNFNGQSYSADKAEQIVTRVEQATDTTTVVKEN